jgi:hypothetical protein
MYPAAGHVALALDRHQDEPAGHALLDQASDVRFQRGVVGKTAPQETDDGDCAPRVKFHPKSWSLWFNNTRSHRD